MNKQDPDRIDEPRFVKEAAVASGKTDAAFLVAINTNGHALIGDEPQSLGGTNLGPGPYDLLSAALASCTVMTLNFFARREKLPLEHVEVVVKHNQIHAEDCTDCDKTSGRVDRFYRNIHLSGDLNDEQRTQLLAIADRCPVHKTLKNEIQIVSQLV